MPEFSWGDGVPVAFPNGQYGRVDVIRSNELMLDKSVKIDNNKVEAAQTETLYK